LAKGPQLPDKLFFKIGEVAELVGVKPHVLRYWETEFPTLRPMKTRGSHRVYKRADVELAQLIKRLLHDEGYTISGAKRRLRDTGRDRRASAPDPGAARETALRAELMGVRQTLLGLLEELDRIVAADVPEPHVARVERVSPAAVRHSVPVQATVKKPSPR
jgi:DNA-binding transcriptional MerR regulator